jgi:hypothetical protein
VTFLQLVVFLLVIGFLLWAVKAAPFVDASIKPIITWVVVVLAVLWVLGALGWLGPLNTPILNHR